METIESEGKSVAEAVESALKKAGLRRDQVEVQILQEGSSGFLGLGAKPARVKITEKRWGEPSPAGSAGKAAERQKTRPAPGRHSHAAAPARRPPASHGLPQERPAQEPRPAPPSAGVSQERPPEHRPAPSSTGLPQERPAREPRPAPPSAGVSQERPPEHRHSSQPRTEKPKCEDPQAACAQALGLIQEILRLMQFQDVSTQASWEAEQERVKLSLSGADAERLVGQEPKALESLQFLTTLILNRRINAQVAVQVDVAGYWAKREKEILSQVERGIEEVKRTGKPHRLEPMDALMRRLVHRHFAGHPDVLTASEGEGTWRKIVLRPRQG